MEATRDVGDSRGDNEQLEVAGKKNVAATLAHDLGAGEAFAGEEVHTVGRSKQMVHWPGVYDQAVLPAFLQNSKDSN